MKKYLLNYLASLSLKGQRPVLYGAVCNYREFIMYCLFGPDESILQLTFAPEKHSRLVHELQQLNLEVRFRPESQKKFFGDTMLAEYFRGTRTVFPETLRLPLLAAGTAYQQRVWQQLRTIPYGSTVTYQQLAELAGSPRGARSAGLACGANPISLIIPCHRVVAANGLGGFAGGLQVKKKLLSFERDDKQG